MTKQELQHLLQKPEHELTLDEKDRIFELMQQIPPDRVAAIIRQAVADGELRKISESAPDDDIASYEVVKQPAVN